MEEQVLDQLLDWIRNRHFGKYRATVSDNKDPTNRGRVQVKVPAVLGDLEVWAMPCLPMTGSNMGVYVIPEPDAGVWVEFEGGDPSFPIWTGGFWVDNELPKDHQNTAATPPKRLIRSQNGLMLLLDDDAKEIHLSASNGENLLTIEAEAGNIKLTAATKVTVEAPAIELVEGATQPLVLGTELMNYLNQLAQNLQAHTHPHPFGPTGPPAGPVPTPTSGILSQKVKTD